MGDSEKSSEYEQNSLSLTGSVAMGTGVMIGAGIFALPGRLPSRPEGCFHLLSCRRRSWQVSVPIAT